ncbi:MAG TPA: phage minor head protein, partial [Lacipirellulaceae bacterium]|nr:phage minor head protein [Lacipirellulaceae bacterium]
VVLVKTVDATEERRIRRAVRNYLAAQYEAAAQQVEDEAKAATDPLDDGGEIDALMRRYYPGILERAWGEQNGAIGVDLVWDLENPRVQETLDELALQVRRVADTTREQIAALVGRQAAEGWSVEQLAREIRQLGEVESRERSLLIARTESASAYSKGSILQWRASGIVDAKQWFVGTKPCAFCQGLADKVVPLDEEFSAGIQHPPAHPACTCAVAAVVA